MKASGHAPSVPLDSLPGVLRVSGDDVPLYCPRCQRPSGRGATLCADCGERLLVQGYCPICERFWARPVGSDCPKHDVPLDDRPPARAPAEGARWVTAGLYADALKAEAPRIRLEAEGIPTFVEGERMGGHSMYPVATGGVKLQVPQPMLADARVLLAQTWAAPPSADDLDDAWDELAPDPGAARRSVMRGLIYLVLFGPMVLVIVAKLLGM